MPKVLVITPVKDSIETALESARSVAASSAKLEHVIFNDFSQPTSKELLEKSQTDIGFTVFHLDQVTKKHPPNYNLVLQTAQKLSLQKNLPLLIVESDVVVRNDTVERLLTYLNENPQSGMVAAVTVDEKGVVNYPYLRFQNEKNSVIKTKHSLSFCATLLSLNFLRSYDFKQLDESKDWYDVPISRKSRELGFQNTLLMDTSVWHRPHSSRPWKKQKYTNPVRYYISKFWNGKDKI